MEKVEPVPEGEEGDAEDGTDEKEGDGEKSWWEWFTDKVNAAKGWALDTAHRTGDKIEEAKGKIGGERKGDE